jgi:hypothetical protein
MQQVQGGLVGLSSSSRQQQVDTSTRVEVRAEPGVGLRPTPVLPLTPMLRTRLLGCYSAFTGHAALVHNAAHMSDHPRPSVLPPPAALAPPRQLPQRHPVHRAQHHDRQHAALARSRRAPGWCRRAESGCV